MTGLNKIFSSLLLLLFSLGAMAQTPTKPTLDDLMWAGANYWKHQPRNTQTAWWGDLLVRLEVERAAVMTDSKGKAFPKETLLFTTQDVNAVLDTAQYGKLRSLMYAQFPETQKSLALLQTSKAKLLYDWKAGRIVWLATLPTGGNHQDFHQGSRSLAYVKDHNLYVQTADGKQHQVSTDGSRQLVYGQSVHRDEFGIHKGTFWSPDGSRLAFYRMDQSMVSDFPLVDTQVSDETRVAQPAPEAYPMAGMAMHKVTVGVFSPSTGQTVWLQAGDPTNRYFTNIAWSPDGQYVYMFELPRSQDRADLVQYDATTGARLRVLYTETNARFVEPQNPIVFLPWDSSKFILQSERDGFNHLYLYNNQGKLLKQLTSGKFEILEFMGFNAKNKSIIVRSNESGHIRESLYAVQLSNGKRTRLDNGRGVHRATLSANGAFVRDTWSSPQDFRVSEIISTTNGKRTLGIDKFDDPLKGFVLPTFESGSLTAADGKTPLYYRLVKPADFDPTKKYPTIVYVYGGPHAVNVKEGWNYMSRPWETYMANRGYVLFILDNRGSGDRGFEFESCTHRRLGEIEVADQMQGVSFLKQQPWVDQNRIGVHGWSFGGFMTTNLMLTHPEVFKVGVAGGPVLDWKYYEVMYGERYMDTPQENPEGYAATSMVNKAKNLKGRLQIIVGYNDPVCLLQHSLAFLRAAEDAGTQPDYFVYPGQEHNMMGRDMIHLHERITRYFDDYLKPLGQ